MYRQMQKSGWTGTLTGALLLGLVFVACAQSPQPAGSSESAGAGGGTSAAPGTTGENATGGSGPYAGGVTYPWSDRLNLAAAGSDPYAGGQNYAWVGPKGSGALGSLVSTDSDLSDLNWTAASNLWGPVEKDRSNGEQAAADGKPLTIGGQVYAKGLGVHAGAEIQYTLGGFCTTFNAQVGLDDEVGDRGSVNFQLLDGSTVIYDSGVVRGADRPRPVSADISGVQTLRLVVTDGGDNVEYDHADWGNAVVSCESTLPGAGISQLSDLGPLTVSSGWGPIEKDRSNGEQAAADGKPLTIAGQVYARGLGVHAPSELSYALGGNCTDFSAQVGIDDEVGNAGSVVFQVFGGTGASPLYQSEVLRGNDKPLPVSVDVSGVQTLRLVVTNAGDSINFDHADWASPVLSCTSTRPQPGTSTNIEYQSMAAQPYGVSEAQGLSLNGKIYTFGGFDVQRGFTPTDRAYSYDPARNSWTPLARMPNRGADHAGITTDGTFIYYAGGYVVDSTGYGHTYGTRAAWRYDPAQNTYSALPDLPTDSASGQLVYLDGKLHHFGGLERLKARDISTHYVLDLAQGAAGWTLAAPLPLPRNHLGSAVLNGKIYAIGGQTGNDDDLITHPEVFAYDPATDVWTAAASLKVARSHHSNSTFVMNGRIIVAGGETAHTVPTADVSAYDPATNTWTTLRALPEPRLSGIGAAIGNNEFYFSAGINTVSNIWRATGWKATLN